MPSTDVLGCIQTCFWMHEADWLQVSLASHAVLFFVSEAGSHCVASASFFVLNLSLETVV